MRQPAHQDSSKSFMGLALILLAVVAGLGLAALLYKWERSERAVATIPPTRLVASSPSPTPDLRATPQATPTPAPELPPGVVSYSRDIQPIFKARCLACHGAAALGGLNLSSYDATLSSGNHAPIVIPSSATESILYRSLRGEASGIAPMPPGPPLSDEQIEVIGRWIDQGAPEN